MKNLNRIDRHRISNASHSSFQASTQSDRARLIYSGAFRRLQQKAQVFSLESNSAVRSRLTHSVEVSHIGRYIIARVSEKIDGSMLDEETKDYWKKNSLALSTIVETACLMHDIGNPPFGHFGEAAIAQWAESANAMECLKLALNGNYVTDWPLEDFKNFDGNPQGFRIITKLQGEDGYYGLNLTYTQLVAFLKYTYSPKTKPKGTENNIIPFSKKIGFFDTELDIIEAAWDKLEMRRHSRHPLGFLMEASDDISYCISDIEDGIEKNIIQEEHFKEKILSGLAKVKSKFENPKICETLEKSLSSDDTEAIGSFLSFKTALSNYLVDSVAQIFVDNYDDFVKLEVQKEIISKDTLEHALLDILKVYTGDYLFTSSEAECMELSGFSIISGILEKYQSILCLRKEQFLYLIDNNYKGIKDNRLHIHRRLFNRLPKKHLNAYKCAIIGQSIPEVNKEAKRKQIDLVEYFNSEFKSSFMRLDPTIEWNLRTHLIVDFVSGMTDQFSMEFYQMIKGINVKS
ncbi:TPA: dGTPase [Proteus mirabilis]|uniref:dGTPase n=1 Tax=Proteus mirabilis TaxID=584 RepID=UPI0029E9078B|nr:dGTPase [Proteus mirabilis]